MNGPLSHAQAELGRPITVAAAALAALGALALLAGLALPAARAATLAALAASWLFFAGLAAGGVALSAVARVAHGKFLDAALPLAESPAAFSPAALALFALVVVGAPFWMPPHAHAGGLWALALRDLAAAAVLFGLGRSFLRASAAERWGEKGSMRAAILYLLAYPCAIALFTVDLVMRLSDSAPSGIVPVQAFMAAFLSAVAWTTLLSARRHLEPAVRWDLGRLLYGFSAFWAYLVWCSFLPVWYANLPDEAGEILARLDHGWAILTWGIIATVFIIPFVALVSERAKRHRVALGLGATSVLAGLYGERFLLVVRPVQPSGGLTPWLVGGLVAAGVAGLFVLIVGARLGKMASRAA